MDSTGALRLFRLFRLSRFRNAYCFRGALVWAAVRMGAGAAGVGGPNVIQEAFILLVVGTAVLVDAKRREEDFFLANLGVPAAAIFAWALPLAFVFEVLLP